MFTAYRLKSENGMAGDVVAHRFHLVVAEKSGHSRASAPLHKMTSGGGKQLLRGWDYCKFLAFRNSANFGVSCCYVEEIHFESEPLFAECRPAQGNAFPVRRIIHGH